MDHITKIHFEIYLDGERVCGKRVGVSIIEAGLFRSGSLGLAEVLTEQFFDAMRQRVREAIHDKVKVLP